MTPFALNVSTCHRCPKHDRKGGCLSGGASIVDAARSGACPLGKFPPLASTSVGPSFDLSLDPELLEQERRRLRAGGCCSPPSNA